MNTYQRVLVKDTDRFAVQNFPGLNASLQQISEQTKHEPLSQVTDMLLSFVTGHWLDSKLANAFPQLTAQLISHSLPIGQLENLFEAGKNNPSFKKDLETYVRQTLQTASPRH